ncbi:hypothetical protein [Candidatus Poriferisodalis sp.]|uniref:hypothetical protein n=1 Tax=Candidatus Poriferisodalis sp. TaxID=3101277 RepID=UPI003B015F10
MSEADEITIIDDENTEKWTRWSEEFARREFTDEELDRMLSTWRPLPRPATADRA